jgi:hypothetical protein
MSQEQVNLTSHSTNDDGEVITYRVNISLLDITPLEPNDDVYCPESVTYEFFFINDDHVDFDDEYLINLFWYGMTKWFKQDYDLDLGKDVWFNTDVEVIDM